MKTIIIHTFQIKETTKALWDKVQINNNNKKKMEKNLNRESWHTKFKKASNKQTKKYISQRKDTYAEMQKLYS